MIGDIVMIFIAAMVWGIYYELNRIRKIYQERNWRIKP